MSLSTSTADWDSDVPGSKGAVSKSTPRSDRSQKKSKKENAALDALTSLLGKETAGKGTSQSGLEKYAYLFEDQDELSVYSEDSSLLEEVSAANTPSTPDPLQTAPDPQSSLMNTSLLDFLGKNEEPNEVEDDDKSWLSVSSEWTPQGQEDRRVSSSTSTTKSHSTSGERVQDNNRTPSVATNEDPATPDDTFNLTWTQKLQNLAMQTVQSPSPPKSATLKRDVSKPHVVETPSRLRFASRLPTPPSTLSRKRLKDDQAAEEDVEESLVARYEEETSDNHIDIPTTLEVNSQPKHELFGESVPLEGSLHSPLKERSRLMDSQGAQETPLMGLEQRLEWEQERRRELQIQLAYYQQRENGVIYDSGTKLLEKDIQIRELEQEREELRNSMEMLVRTNEELQKSHDVVVSEFESKLQVAQQTIDVLRSNNNELNNENEALLGMVQNLDAEIKQRDEELHDTALASSPPRGSDVHSTASLEYSPVLAESSPTENVGDSIVIRHVSKEHSVSLSDSRDLWESPGRHNISVNSSNGSTPLLQMERHSGVLSEGLQNHIDSLMDDLNAMKQERTELLDEMKSQGGHSDGASSSNVQHDSYLQQEMALLENPPVESPPSMLDQTIELMENLTTMIRPSPNLQRMPGDTDQSPSKTFDQREVSVLEQLEALSNLLNDDEKMNSRVSLEQMSNILKSPSILDRLSSDPNNTTITTLESHHGQDDIVRTERSKQAAVSDSQVSTSNMASFGSHSVGSTPNPWLVLIDELRAKCIFLEQDRDQIVALTGEMLEQAKESFHYELELAVRSTQRKAAESLRDYHKATQLQVRRLYNTLCPVCQAQINNAL